MRVLLFQSDSDARSFNAVASVVPVLAFEGTYSANEIPYPVYFSKRGCTTGNEIKIEAGEYFIAFDLAKLVRVESSGKGSLLYLSDGSHWQCENMLDYFEKELTDHKFYRIHPNHLINIHFLQRMVKCDAYVVLTNSELLPAKLPVDSLITYLESNDIL